MAGNTVEKHKDKIILDISIQKEKIGSALSSLKESVLKMQEGDGTPYWNGEHAYHNIANVLSYIDSSYALLDTIEDCQKQLKNNR